MEKNNIKHNGVISFWKFMFTMMIIILHIGQLVFPKGNYIMRAGSIGVEFFFIVSGYLLGKKALRLSPIKNCELGKETFNYIFKKIKAFYPFIVIAFLMSLGVEFIKGNVNGMKLANSILDLFFLNYSGLKYTTFLGISWYITAMLISMLILYPLILKYKDNFTYIIAPIIIFFLGGYLLHKYNGRICDPGIWDVFCMKGILRAFLELTIGVITYKLSNMLSRLDFTKVGKYVLNIIELIGFISIFFIVNKENAHNKYDTLMILMLSIAIAIAFSEKTILFRFCNNRLFYTLEKYTLSIYLNQIWVINLIKYIVNKYQYKMENYIYYLIIILADIIISIAIYYFINNILVKLGKFKKILVN